MHRCTRTLTKQCPCSQEALAGELALVPPLLGASQTLLNREHWAVYYEVRTLQLSHWLRECV